MRLAEVESVTTESTITSRMDMMSEGYAEDTPPTEIFNIIEEYSDSSLGKCSSINLNIQTSISIMQSVKLLVLLAHKHILKPIT